MVTTIRDLMLGTAVLSVCSSAAFAQTAGPSATASVAPLQADPGEIIVTANKREQNLNDVGLTVAVVSGQALKERQITSVADLAPAIPGLSYSNSATGTPVYTLRGVGFNESSLGAYPTVSVYVDEVPLPFPVLTTHTAFDLERVEVLKGPQGTLFGQNATGGAINFIAAKPSSTFSSGVDLSYGRFNEVIGDAYITGPLTDTLTARASGHIEHADGWQISNTRPGDRNGKLRNYAGRLLFAFEPTDRLHFALNLNGWKDDSQTQAPQYIARTPPQQPMLDPVLAAEHFSPDRPRAADWTPGYPYAHNRLLQGSLRSTVDVSSDLTLTSLTSYVDYKQHQGTDGDGLAATSFDISADVGRIRSFSQELRLSNGTHNRFRWIVGGNYEHSRVAEATTNNFPNSSTHQSFELFGLDFSSTSYSNRQRMTNYAFFGNGEFDLTPHLTLKGGVRYTDSDVNTKICNHAEAGDVGNFFFNILLGGAFGPYTGQCFSINNTGTTVGGVAPGAPGEFVGRLHENNVSWRTGIDWKVANATLLYVNVAKGYKAGSFPSLSGSGFSQYAPVTQESVIAYEGGFKASMLDRALQLNGAVFYYKYDNKQLRTKTIVPPFGILDTLENIPKSDIKGFELEAIVRPVRGLVLNGAFTYLDAKIKRFVGINAGGVAANFAGTRIPFTPKAQLGINADYDVPLNARLNLFVGSGVTYRSNTIAAIGGDQNPPGATPTDLKIFGIKGYALVDARVGVRDRGDRWRFSIWGKNITNKYYWNNVVAAFDTIARYAGRPATYGVSLGYKF